MTQDTSPSISVVIVCWNCAAYVQRCLNALETQTDRDFEVIVVDNGSTDGAAAGLAEAHPALQLRVERLDANVGFAAASNLGARLAKAQWLALLNPDAFPRPDWLEQLRKAAALNAGCFFASRQIQANRPELLDGEGDIYFTSGLALRRNYNSPLEQAGPAREVFSACAAAAMYPRADFLDAGAFDVDYFAYQEDVDLGFRLRLRGMRCMLVPQAAVDHVGGASTGHRSAFALYHGHRNLVWTYVKNMPSPWVWCYLPLHVVMNLLSVVYFVLAGRSGPILRAKRDALLGLPRALSKRRLVQARRTTPGREVVRYMNRNPFGPFQGWMRRQHPKID